MENKTHFNSNKKMKQILLSTIIAFSSANLFAQKHKHLSQSTPIEITESKGRLVFGKIKLKKGSDIQIMTPITNGDFMFIKHETEQSTPKVLFNIGNKTEIIGMSPNNVKILDGQLNINKGAIITKNNTDDLENINQLPISEKAKAIAGKKMSIIGWKKEKDEYIITAKLKNEKYNIYFREALMTREIKL